MYGDILLTIGTTAIIICALLLLHIVIVSFITPVLDAYASVKTKQRREWEKLQERQISSIINRLGEIEKNIPKDGGSNKTP